MSGSWQSPNARLPDENGKENDSVKMHSKRKGNTTSCDKNFSEFNGTASGDTTDTGLVEMRNFEADKRTALAREIYDKLLRLKSLKYILDLEISGLHHALPASYLHNFHQR